MDATNLVAYLPFDTDTADLCGNSWTTYGSPTISDNSLQLDGSSYLKLNGSIALGGQDFTIHGWAKMTSAAQDWGGLFALNGNKLRLIRYNNESSALENGVNGSVYKITTTPLTERFHFAYIYQHTSKTWKTYINGNLVDTRTKALTRTTFSNVFIGGNGDNNSTGGNKWAGSIDEFMIFDNIALWTDNFTPPTADDYTNLKIAMKLAAGVDATLALNLDFERKVKNPLTTWRYENAGDDDTSVIGGATLIGDLPESKSVTGNAFYQITWAKCFDLPATSEIWIKFDVYFDGSHRWRAYNGGANGTTGITAQTSGKLSFFCNDSNAGDFSNVCIANQLQTVLLHMVSGSTNGVIEAWVDRTLIYRYTGDVNHGQDFADIYLQSDGGNTFFSNVIISNAQIDFVEGWHNIHLDVNREVEKTVSIAFDFERRVKNIIDFQFFADLELSYHLPVTFNADFERNVIRSLDLDADLEILDVIPIEFTSDLERKILTKFKLYPTDNTQYFSGGSSTPIVIPSQATIPPAFDSEASLQYIEVTIAEQQITDQVKATGIIPFEILSAVEGQVLDYVCDMRVEKVTKRGILYSADCCSDIDALLFTQIAYKVPESTTWHKRGKDTDTGEDTDTEITTYYPPASEHVNGIANALGLSPVMQFDNFLSTVLMDDLGGVTYNDLIRDVFGWSSRVPTMLINVYIRNGKLFVIQRGHEANIIDISNVDMTLPVITHELVRTTWGASPWSKTETREVSTMQFVKGDETTPDSGDDSGGGDSGGGDDSGDDEAEKSWISVGHVTVEDGEGITVTDYYYDSDGVLMRTVASFYSSTDSKKNTITTTTNSYNSDGLLDMTTVEAIHTGEPTENTMTVTTYGYLTLPDDRKFLSTEMVQNYSADKNGGYKLDDTRVTTKSPTGRGQGASTDNQGNIDTSGNIGDDRVTPRSKYGTSRLAKSINGSGSNWKEKTETEERTLNGISLYDSSFPIHNEDKLIAVTNALRWLNRKTCETVTLSIFGFPHLIDFNDRVLLDGNEYFLVSNTLKITPRLFNEQALTLVRWF